MTLAELPEDHHHHAPLSDIESRVKKLEALLIEKKLVDPASPDKPIDPASPDKPIDIYERMRARMDTCKERGFDAIDTDNVDAHNYETMDENRNVVNTGTNFRLTLDESIAYIRRLAEEAHARGQRLSIGLKNAEEMAPEVVSDVDWMLTEDCYVDNWCQAASVFVENGKPVFMAEYEDLVPDFTPACELAKSLGYFAIWRDPSLADGTYLACE